MNCARFKGIAVDLARGELHALEIERALTHARLCRKCGERLELERSLAARLAAFARATEAESASAGLAAELRRAFRERAGQAPFVEPAVSATRPHPAWTWSLGAAAIVGTLSFALLRLEPDPDVGRAADSPTLAGSTRPVVSRVRPRPSPTSARTASGGAPSPVQRKRPSRPGEGRSTPVPALPRSSAVPPHAVVASAPRMDEILEDASFLPLVDGERLEDAESLQIVEIEIPPAALGPTSTGAADEGAEPPIRAEVLVGHDGVARAIRLLGKEGGAHRGRLSGGRR